MQIAVAEASLVALPRYRLLSVGADADDGDGCAGVSDEPFKPFCKWVDAELVFVFGAARDVGKAVCFGHIDSI